MFYLCDSFGNTIVSGHVDVYQPEFETISVSQLRNCEFQADGNELERAFYILGRTTNRRRLFKFYGNDVVTIVKNWNN